jgi:hypothetical protein
MTLLMWASLKLYPTTHIHHGLVSLGAAFPRVPCYGSMSAPGFTFSAFATFATVTMLGSRFPCSRRLT